MRGNFSKATRPGVKSWFGLAYGELPKKWEAVFEMIKSDKNYEEDVMASGLGPAMAKSEGDSIAYDSMQQTYTNRSTHTTFGLGYMITREELEDNQYAKLVAQRTQSLAHGMNQTKEIVGANVINNGYDSAYTFGDGKALFATDHPSSAGTFSNKLAIDADLSETSIEDALVAISQKKNDRGLIINASGLSLHVPAQSIFEAERILKSTLRNNTNTNAINAIGSIGMLPKGYFMNPFFTDADGWFIRTDIPGMTCYQRRDLEVQETQDFDTQNKKVSATERYSFTNYDPRSVFGSQGA
jgi:hypothetical protein